MKRITITALIILLFYTRFVNLGWGFPYPMHPDERNMAVAVQQLSCPSLVSLSTCFNPHFFAYGQLPLYLAYAGIQVYHAFTGAITVQPTFLESTFALRLISALSSILLVFVLLNIFELIVKITKWHYSFEAVRLWALLFLIFQPYSIQFAHFGTTESLLMLFYSLIIYYSLLLLRTTSYELLTIIYLGLFSGLALGTKTSSVLFLGVPVFVLLLKLVRRNKGVRQSSEATIEELIVGICIYLFTCLFFFFLSSPQSILNWSDFISSMNYESAVGLGTYVAFYTRQFVGTTPVVFQLQKILPYALGLPQLILSILGLIFLPSSLWIIINSIWSLILQVARVKGTRQRAKNINPNGYIDVFEHWWGKLRVTESAKLYDLLRLALLLSFLPSSFFFAKWTRFVSPSFPLFSLFSILFCIYIVEKILLNNKKQNFIRIILLFSFLILVAPGIAFLSIYTSPDVRFSASNWIYKNVPVNSKILTETANVIDIPVPNPYSQTPIPLYQINSFNFYDLDEDSKLQSDLSEALKLADYIVIPSRRIFMNHPPVKYPQLGVYYANLLSEKNGFKKVAEFSSYPKVQVFGTSLFELPDEQAEETWTVFDHPVIRIYKKIQAPNSKENELDFSDYQTTSYELLTKNYTLLVADTPDKWEKGLMYVKSKQDMGQLDGMIFTFPDSQKRMFWNKNTLSHLTLYWINNKKIVGISDLPSITESKEVVTVTSPSAADTVIEIVR